MAKAAAVKWTREHFLIALNLYCKLPFGKLHKSNRIIIETAAKMGRTPSYSLALKLCNFTSLDPVQRAREHSWSARGDEARQGHVDRISGAHRKRWELRASNCASTCSRTTKQGSRSTDTRPSAAHRGLGGPTETQATVKVRAAGSFSGSPFLTHTMFAAVSAGFA